MESMLSNTYNLCIVEKELQQLNPQFDPYLSVNNQVVLTFA